jgi:hypothetical protein
MYNLSEEVNIFTHNSKSSFLSSDEICNKFIDECGSLDQIEAGDIQMAYHRSGTLASITLPSVSAENVVQLA